MMERKRVSERERERERENEDCLPSSSSKKKNCEGKIFTVYNRIFIHIYHIIIIKNSESVHHQSGVRAMWD